MSSISKKSFSTKSKYNAIRVRAMLYINLILFRISMDIAYIFFVAPVFEYMGFRVNIELIQYSISWIVFLSMSAIAPYELKKLSDFFMTMGIVLLLTPLTSMYGLDTALPSEPVLVTVLSLSIIYVLVNSKLVKPIKIPYFQNSYLFAMGICVLGVLYLIFWYGLSGAVGNFNLDFTKVYEFRRKTSALTDVGLLGYVNIWVQSVLNIFLLAMFLKQKRYTLVLLTLLIQVFFFGVSTHKSILIFPIIVFASYFFYKRKSLTYHRVILIAALVVLGLTLYAVKTSDLYISSMLVRRAFFTPAWLTFAYFEFFGENSFVLWSNSVLSSLSEYPYSASIPETIGFIYYNRDVNANNGFISSGYAHGGVFGVIFYSLILGYLLVIIDSLSKSGVQTWFATGLLLIPLQTTLMSVDLSTTLLTNGLLLSIFLLIIIRRKRTL